MGGGFHMGSGGGGVHAFGGGGVFRPNGGFTAHSFSRSVSGPSFGGRAITSRRSAERSFQGRNSTAGSNAARLQGNAARLEGNAARLQGNAARVEGNAARLQGNAARIEGAATRLQGNVTGAVATRNIISAHPQVGGAHHARTAAAVL
jgi:hypothetical protein